MLDEAFEKRVAILEQKPRPILERMCRIEHELQRRRIHDPLKEFFPIPKQQAFINAPHRFRMFAGGNRTGKTHICIAEVASYALGFRPWTIPGRTGTLEVRLEDLPRELRVRNGRDRVVQIPSKGIICADGMDAGISKVIVPKLQELCLPYIEKFVRGSGGTTSGVLWKNGSTTDFASYDQEARKIAGRDYDYGAGDEPMPRDFWMELFPRLMDRCGRFWWTLTGVAQPWMFDEIYCRGMSTAEEDANWFAVVAHQDENPHLDHDPEAESVWDEDEIEARRTGSWKHLSGRVYKTFDEDVHVCEPFEIPSDWPRVCVCDPHDRRPFAIIWAAINPQNDFFIYREWPDQPYERIRSCDMSIGEYADLIQSLEGDEDVRFRLMDPRFGVAAKVGMEPVADRFVKHGLYFDTRFARPSIGPGELSTRHMAVRKLLFWNKKLPLDELNRPKLYVFDNCRNVIWSFLHYVWDEHRRMDKVKEAVREPGKDFMDCVGWLAGSGYTGQPLRVARSRYQAIGSYGES